MQEWVPIPGSAKARLIEAALYHFQRAGFEACSVTELAAKAGVTTGSLYHHFGSKLGLYAAVRADLEKRITDRMEGAAAVATDAAVRGPDSSSRPAVRAALLVAFDAAVRFDASLLLGESPRMEGVDPVADAVRSVLPVHLQAAAPMLVAAWRTALVSVADGTPVESARAALEYVL